MSQFVNPVAPSINDIRAQIRKPIEDAIQKAKDEKTKLDEKWKKIKEDKKAHADELNGHITELTTELGKAKDVAKQKELILGHQKVVVEHHEHGANLNRQDQEYEGKLEGYQKEIERLEEDLKRSATADLGD